MRHILLINHGPHAAMQEVELMVDTMGHPFLSRIGDHIKAAGMTISVYKIVWDYPAGTVFVHGVPF